MKKVLIALGVSVLLSSFSFADITKAQAEEKIKDYLVGSNHVSKVIICESEKYYVREAILESHEKIGNVVRKVYVNKKDGSILPIMVEHSDYCYMLKKQWKR